MFHLLKYSNHNDYLQDRLGLDLPWVVYDGTHVHYSIDGIKYELGDIIIYNGHKCVCVIPSDFIPDKKARFIVADWQSSSKWFNVSTDSNNSLYVNVPTPYLQSYTTVPNIKTCIGSDFNTWLDANDTNTINSVTTTSWGRICSDKNDSNFSIGKDMTSQGFKNPSNSNSYRVNPNDVATAWYNNTDSAAHIPSPYLNYLNNTTTKGDEMIFNIGIYNYPGTATANFNGLVDTKGILTYYNNVDAINWTNNSSGTYQKSDYQVAAKVVNDALNNGTTDMNNVVFYLPSIGELGFVMARLKFINSIISTLSGGIQVPTSSRIWGSTQYSAYYAYYLYTSDGSITNRGKYYGLTVRAFLQI